MAPGGLERPSRRSRDARGRKAGEGAKAPASLRNARSAPGPSPGPSPASRGTRLVTRPRCRAPARRRHARPPRCSAPRPDARFPRLWERGPAWSPSQHRFEEELHKLHTGDVPQRHWGRKAPATAPKRLRWLFCPDAPDNGGASPGPSGVGTAGALRTRWRADPRCRLRVPPSAG